MQPAVPGVVRCSRLELLECVCNLRPAWHRLPCLVCVVMEYGKRKLDDPAEAPGQELKVMTKSAPASQAVSRSSTRPSSPMPILPQQPSGSAAQAGEPEPAAGAASPSLGPASKSVTFSKSLPKDPAHLPSRYGGVDVSETTALARTCVLKQDIDWNVAAPDVLNMQCPSVTV